MRPMSIDHSLPGLTSSPTTENLVKALVAAQAAYPAIEKTGENTFARYEYMTYGGICEALRPALTKNGLSLPQVCLTKVGEEWIAVGTLRHVSGEFVTSLCPLYLGKEKDGTPRADMQSLGAAYTYAKKYLLLGLVGGWAEEDDDAAAITPPRQQQQAKPAPTQKGPGVAKKAAEVAAKSMEIEALARKAIDAAEDWESVTKVLGRVELRVSEKACEPAVLERLRALADERFPVEV